MARPNKIGIPYFSLDTDFFEDTKIKMLLSKFKSDGITVYFKIINTGYKEHGYFLPADEDNLLILSGELSIEYEALITIIEFMCNKNLFNVIQKQKNNILTSERMQLQYLAGTERREEIFFDSRYLLIDPVREKRKTHKAKIYVDNKCISETEFLYNNNPEKGNINSQSKVKVKESESEIEKEIEKESKTGKDSTSETFLNQKSFEELPTSHFELVKNLYSTYTRIRDPNEETHIKPILNFFLQIPESMSEDDIVDCIKDAFAKLTPNKGVMMEYLISNIQSKITAKNEEILGSEKKKQLKEADSLRKEEKSRLNEENKAYAATKIKEYKSFLEKNLNQFTYYEQQEILRFLRENKVLQAGAIIEPKMESAELV